MFKKLAKTILMFVGLAAKPLITKARGSTRLHVEELESRIVPSSYSWSGRSTESANWSDLANWYVTGQMVPPTAAITADDTLIFDLTMKDASNANPIKNSTDDNVGAVKSIQIIGGSGHYTGTISVSPGELAVTNFAMSGDVTGPTFVASTDNLGLQVAGNFVWSGGKINSKVEILKDGSGSINADSNGVQLDGTSRLTIDEGAMMTFNSGWVKLLTSTALFDNYGAVVIEQGASGFTSTYFGSFPNPNIFNAGTITLQARPGAFQMAAAYEDTNTSSIILHDASLTFSDGAKFNGEIFLLRSFANTYTGGSGSTLTFGIWSKGHAVTYTFNSDAFNEQLPQYDIIAQNSKFGTINIIGRNDPNNPDDPTQGTQRTDPILNVLGRLVIPAAYRVISSGGELDNGILEIDGHGTMLGFYLNPTGNGSQLYVARSGDVSIGDGPAQRTWIGYDEIGGAIIQNYGTLRISGTIYMGTSAGLVSGEGSTTIIDGNTSMIPRNDRSGDSIEFWNATLITNGDADVNMGTVDSRLRVTFKAGATLTTMGAGMVQINGKTSLHTPPDKPMKFDDKRTFSSNIPVEINDGVQVAANSALSGDGEIDTPTLNNDGIIGPGDIGTVGKLTFGANVAFSNTATLAIDLGGSGANPTPGADYDQIVVNGAGNTISLGGALALKAIPTLSVSEGTVFTIIANETGIPISGTFAGLAEGATVDAAGWVLAISYVGGDNAQSVTLTVVSQPATFSGNIWWDDEPNTGGDDHFGFHGVKVSLQDGDGNTVASTWSDDLGNYSLSAVAGPSYKVVVAGVNGWQFLTDNSFDTGPTSSGLNGSFDAGLSLPVADFSGNFTVTSTVNYPIAFLARDPVQNGPREYLLDGNAPAGSAITVGDGEFTWTPTSPGPVTFNINFMEQDPGTFDWNLVGTQQVTINVRDFPNPAPSGLTVTAGSAVSFQAAATDPSNGTFTFALDSSAPDGATITPAGLFSWTPGDSQAGDATFNVHVIWADGSSDVRQVTVHVRSFPDPLPDIATATAGIPFTFQAQPINPSGAVAFSLDNPPAGASIASNGTFTWTPTAAQGGSTNVFNVIVRWSDNSTSTQTVEIDVAPLPIDTFGSPYVATLTAGALAAFQAQDPGLAGPITYTLAPGSATGASVDPNTGVFSWLPTSAQEGVNTFTINATSGTVVDTQSVTVNVRSFPNPVASGATANFGLPVVFQAIALDPTDPTSSGITYTLEGAPATASINPTSGIFVWVPTAAQVGSNVFTVRATWSDGTSDTQTITVDVLATPAVTNVVVNAGTAPIVNYDLTGTTATITTAGNTTFATGDSVLIAGIANTNDDGVFIITNGSSNSNTFTFTNVNAGAATAGVGGTASDALGAGSLGTGLGGSQRSMVDSITYTFNQSVSLGVGAFTIALSNGVLINSDPTGTTVGTLPSLNWSSPDGGTTWVVTFSGSGVVGNSIADGVYDITLNGAAVTAASGTTGDTTNTFVRKFGDVNGDGTVSNLPDYSQFRTALNYSNGDAAYRAYFDYNADGNLSNLPDYSQFRLRLNTSYSGFTATI